MKNIYFIVSSTPTTMGKMIRKVTCYPYNHISFALEKDLSDLMSFSRYYYATPLYGGYVNECFEAYVKESDCSQIKVFEIPVEEEYYVYLTELLTKMNENPKQYQYNSFNAVLQPFHKQVNIPDCYTCEDFCAKILELVHRHVGPIKIPEFCEKFDEYCIYKGQLNDYEHHIYHSDTYKKSISYFTIMKLTGQHFAGLLQKRKKEEQVL